MKGLVETTAGVTRALFLLIVSRDFLDHSSPPVGGEQPALVDVT